jgi:hypothetical protein
VRLVWIFVMAACHPGGAQVEGPTCAAAAEHVRTLVGPERPRAGHIREVFEARCEADAWDDEVRACVVATKSLRQPQHCKAKLTQEQRAALDRALAGPVTRSAPEARACNDYRAFITRLGACTSLPSATRAALMQVYLDLLHDWSRSANRDVATLGAACTSMLDGLHRAFAATCGL